MASCGCGYSKIDGKKTKACAAHKGGLGKRTNGGTGGRKKSSSAKGSKAKSKAKK